MPVHQMAAEDLAQERRFRARYDVELNVKYRTLTAGPALEGTGRTLNVSSCGLLIACEQQVARAGSCLQVSVEWPSLLHGKTPLQLIAFCRVIRCHSKSFAVSLDRYEFRTRAR